MVEEKKEEKTEVKREVEEKRETKKPAKKPAQEASGVPWYLTGALVVLALVVGFALSLVVNPCAPAGTVDCNCPEPVVCPPCEPTGPVTVEVKNLVTHDLNRLQRQQNTILLVFEEKGVKFDAVDVNLDDPANAGMAEEYNIKILPTALVNAKQLKSWAGVNDDLQAVVDEIQAKYPLVGDYYVMKELNLDSYTHLKIFLESPAPDCVKGEKSRVSYYGDPYAIHFVGAQPDLNSFRDRFSEVADFEFRYNPGPASKALFDQNLQEETELLAKYYLAAQEQEKFWEFQRCTLDLLCDKDADGEAVEDEILHCQKDNNTWGTPLTEEQLQGCALDTGLEQALVDEFIANEAEARLAEDRQLAEDYIFTIDGVGIGVTMAVIDCTLTEKAFDVQYILCPLYPDVDYCQRHKEKYGLE